MTPEARDALADRLEQMTKTEFDQLAEDRLRATALALRHRLTRDIQAARAMLTPPIQRKFTDDDALKKIEEVAAQLAEANGNYPAVGDIDVADAAEIKEAVRTLRLFYRRMRQRADWETFCTALEQLETERARQESENLEAQEQERLRKDRAEQNRIETRNRNILRNAASGGPGRDDANVKCVMILPGGTSQEGHSGGRATRATPRLHAALEDLLRYVSSTGWDRDNCAEVDAMNELLYKKYPAITSWDQIPEGIVSQAYEYRQSQWRSRAACPSCRQWLTKIKADFT